MSELKVVDEILEHFGTKGMKWGTRRAAQKFDNRDRSFEALGNRDPNRRQNAKLANKFVAKATEGTVTLNGKKHSLINGKQATELGRRVVSDLMKQGRVDYLLIKHDAMELGDILEHAGVKGMKWGVRKKVSSAASATSAKVGGAASAVSGGAKKVGSAASGKAKKSVEAVKNMTPQQRKALLIKGGIIASVILAGVAFTPYAGIVSTSLITLSRRDIQITDPNLKLDHGVVYTEEILEHFGTKGMKWGVRRAQKKVERAQSKLGETRAARKLEKAQLKLDTRRERAGIGSPKARTHYKKSPKRLTNEELQTRIKRMETEKRYNELNKKDISKGKQIAIEVLQNSGKQVATRALTAVGLSLITAVLPKGAKGFMGGGGGGKQKQKGKGKGKGN